MPPAPLPFPVTALPGRRPGEGQGDLLNTFARKVGNVVRWQRVPGTRRLTPERAPPFKPRGQIIVDPYVISVWDETVTRTIADGTVEAMVGAALAGTGIVTMARNLHTPVQVVAVSGGFAYVLNMETNAVEIYPPNSVDSGLGNVNSVDYYSGYFVFSRSNGTIVATDLQTLEFNDLSFAMAESDPDGLLRVFGSSPVLLACGPSTIEVYQDVGTAPFPFQRVTVIPVGLISQGAIAGGGSQWDRPALFVAHDHTVRMLKGYDPVIVSNEDVSFDIERVARAGLADTLVAQVYTHGDNAMWSLTSDSWTWEFNISTQLWHRRQSYNFGQMVPWRARFAVHSGRRWIAQDELQGGLLEISNEVQDEPSLAVGHKAPLVMRCESASLGEFPANIRLPAVFLDFAVAPAVLGYPDPKVLLSWSHDGGATWSNPLERTLGGQGEYRTLVALRNLGRSSHHGVRLAWEVYDPVPVTFTSAVATRVQPSRPRQVGLGGADG